MPARLTLKPVARVVRVHVRSAAASLAVPRITCSIRQHASAYVSIRQHMSAYVSIRQHTSACVSVRQHTRDSSASARMPQTLRLEFESRQTVMHTSRTCSIRQHTPAHVSIRQRTSACFSVRPHASHTNTQTHTQTHTHTCSGVSKPSASVSSCSNNFPTLGCLPRNSKDEERGGEKKLKKKLKKKRKKKMPCVCLSRRPKGSL